MAGDYDLKSIKIEVCGNMAVNSSQVDKIERVSTRMQKITKKEIRGR